MTKGEGLVSLLNISPPLHPGCARRCLRALPPSMADDTPPRSSHAPPGGGGPTRRSSPGLFRPAGAILVRDALVAQLRRRSLSREFQAASEAFEPRGARSRRGAAGCRGRRSWLGLLLGRAVTVCGSVGWAFGRCPGCRRPTLGGKFILPCLRGFWRLRKASSRRLRLTR